MHSLTAQEPLGACFHVSYLIFCPVLLSTSTFVIQPKVHYSFSFNALIFFLWFLKVSFHLSMACIVPGEKSVLIHYSCDMTFFPWGIFNIFQCGHLLNTSKFNKVSSLCLPLLSFWVLSGQFILLYLFWNIHFLFMYCMPCMHLGGRGQLVRVISLLPLCWFWDSNSGNQA